MFPKLTKKKGKGLITGGDNLVVVIVVAILSDILKCWIVLLIRDCSVICVLYLVFGV